MYKNELKKVMDTTVTKIKETSGNERRKLIMTLLNYKKLMKYIDDNKENVLGYVDQTNHFIEVFNKKTGFYARTGVIENGLDTGRDPFMRDFPQLIDVGVMGHCLHGKSGLCMKSGVQCYQDGLHRCDPNMSVEDFRQIVEECKGKCFSFAIGGRGDFDQHENFEEILKICTENDIVPNFTSSGLGFTEEIVELCKKYCGAVAISNYSHLEKVRMKREKTEEEMLKTRQYIGDKARIQEFVDDGWMTATADENDENYDYLELTYENNNYTYHALKMLIDAGVKTNIHYVVGNNSIDEAMERLQNNDFIDGLNAVIFLLHKPIGLGKESNVLKVNDPRVKEFYHLGNQHHPYKIGYDTCNSPAIVNFERNIPEECYDACEGARHSCYIDSNMKMIPCSFDNQDLKWAVDLRTHSIKEAWDSKQFEDFRNHFRNSCHGCKDRHLCRGGCPLARSIVLCDKKEKDLK